MAIPEHAKSVFTLVGRDTANNAAVQAVVGFEEEDVHPHHALVVAHRDYPGFSVDFIFAGRLEPLWTPSEAHMAALKAWVAKLEAEGGVRFTGPGPTFEEVA